MGVDCTEREGTEDVVLYGRVGFGEYGPVLQESGERECTGV